MYTREQKIYMFILVCTLILTLFGYAWKTKPAIPYVTRPLANVTVPFAYGAAVTLGGVRTGISVIDAALTKLEEIEALKIELADAKASTVTYQEVVAENIRLRQLLRYKQNHPQFEVRAAKIVARDFGNGLFTYTLDVGLKDGVKAMMPVVAPSGVVGFVSDAGEHYARVQTMLDMRSAIGTIVQRPESRVASVVKGNSSHPLSPYMMDVPKDADILVNDTLVTSGLGGLYPKGILVGHVEKIEANQEGYVNQIVVKPSVDFYTLEEVFVITESTESAPVWSKEDLKLIPTTKRDQLEGAKGAVRNENR